MPPSGAGSREGTELARKAPEPREEWLDRGEQLFHDGSFAEALECFDRALELDAEDAEAHYLRGRTLYYLSRDAEAEAAYDRALDVTPDFASALIHKAELLTRVHGWAEEALELLEEAEAAGLEKAERLEAAFVRGIALMELGEYKEALESLSRAVRGDGDWMEALRERGICRFYLWRLEDALRDLARVAKNDPGDAEAHYVKAMIHEHLGQETEADRAYGRAADLDPAAFHVPCRMSREEFEATVTQVVAELPEEFRIRFDNLSFGVRDLPAPEDEAGPDVLGLFVGVPLTSRSASDLLEMPGKVILFRRNLERICPDRQTLKDEIGKTILHEVGHFFGLEEEDMLRLKIH